MIKKELEPFFSTDKYAVAGRAAEEKMQFYLKRFFSQSSDIFVLNNVRIEFEDDAAQMDHLILHPYGVIVVESKSVSSKVQIKDDGQWVRWYGKESSGMASPITQAKLQSRFMRDLLNRAAKPNGFFDRYSFDVFVAISDSGQILWPPSGQISEVCKADQIAERIESRIAELRGIANSVAPLGAEHLAKIAQFLCDNHKPLDFKEKAVSSQAARLQAVANEVANLQAVVQRSIPRMFGLAAATATEDRLASMQNITSAVFAKNIEQSAPAKMSRSDEQTKIGNVCKHCGGTNLEIRFARTYFFYCHNCEKNTSIKAKCETCNGVSSVRKKAKEFFAECKVCSSSKLLHVNS